MKFKQFAAAVANRFNHLMAVEGATILRSNISPDDLWDLYLESIPAEENQIFRQNRYYDANFDKNFIRRLGGIMVAVDNKAYSIWEVKVDSFFQDVANKLDRAVKESNPVNFYMTTERVAGSLPNVDSHNPDITWEHFYAKLPNKLVVRDGMTVNKELGDSSTDYQLLKRGVTELSYESLETVADLISSGNLYRGDDYRNQVSLLKTLKKEYETAENKTLWLWEATNKYKRRVRIYNSVIGTLLKDLTEGVDLERAVSSFEAKVAPENYKRPKALVTAGMVKAAKEKLDELGYTDSLDRRLAKAEEIPLDAYEFVTSQSSKVSLNAMDDLLEDTSKKVKNLKGQEVTYAQFIDLLQPTDKIQLAVTSKLSPNKAVLTTSKDNDAPIMFKWANPFAWSYLGSDTADAIKVRVKEAGGNVDGDVRVSLAWYNADDLDLAMIRGKERIYFSDKQKFGAELDLDMNGLDRHDSAAPVENIFWSNFDDMKDGEYKVYIDCYNKINREADKQGFKVQVEILGEITTFEYAENAEMFKHQHVLTLVKENGQVSIEDVTKITELGKSLEGQLVDVKGIIRAPQQWAEPDNGMKQYFFLTEDFEVDSPVRSFFTEFLNPELTPHRKVFEILGSRTMIQPETANNSSIARGYGFSTSSNKTATAVVTGKTGRKVYQVAF